MDIRKVESDEELEMIVAVQKKIWEFTCNECVPAHLLMAANKIGGSVHGAFVDEQLKGFSLCLPEVSFGRVSMYLYMIGVSPDCQNRQIGEQLMNYQRLFTLKSGFRNLKWTFDPLMSANAHLYLSKLGAKITKFAPDYYGRTIDGSITNRFLVEWDLVGKVSTKNPLSFSDIEEQFVTTSISTFSPSLLLPNRPIALEIPSYLRPWDEKGREAMEKLRKESGQAFQQLLASGKTIKDFTTIYQNGIRRAFYLTD